MKWFKRKHKTPPDIVNPNIYGGENTWHQTGWFDVETRGGIVVAVWFRCQPVQFKQTKVDSDRATNMESMYIDSDTCIPGVIAIELDSNG